MTSSSTVLTQISDTKTKLSEALQQITPDDILIAGLLNFVRARFLTLIIKNINDSLIDGDSEEGLKLAQEPVSADLAAETLVDRIWSDFHHPVFKYYQSQHQALKNEEGKHRKRTVEIRKLNEKFTNIAITTRSFYHDLLKHVLVQHKVGAVVPKFFYEVFSLEESPNALTVHTSKTNNPMVKLVYVAHRSILFLGSISRFQTLLSRFIGPTQPQDFHHALELCHYSELLLPAFGDARNMVGMIHDGEDQKLLALYEFMRASVCRISSKVGSMNYKAMLNSPGVIVEKLNRARLDSKITKKNQFELLTAYFLSLYGYYFNPKIWRRANGVLINGTKLDVVVTDFFQIVNNIAEAGNDQFLLEKMLMLLIGGMFLSHAQKSTTIGTDATHALKFTFKYITYLQVLFIELWEKEKSKALLLLPTLRIVYSWLKSDRLALQYSQRNFEFLKGTALLSNVIYSEYRDESYDHRPTRVQYFDEDVALKEFLPIGRVLSDFDDSLVFNGSDSPSRLIGRFEVHDYENESKSRLVAIGSISRRILQNNIVGIKYDETTKLFNVDDAKPVKKPPKVKPPVTSSQEKSISSDVAPSTPEPTQSKKKKRNRNKFKNKTKKQSSQQQRLEGSTEIESQEVSSPSSTSSDVVEIPQEDFEKQVNSNYIKPTDNVVQTDQIVNAEDLEAKLTNTTIRDENYQNMVNSLFDDSLNNTPKSNQNIWQPQNSINQSLPVIKTSSPYVNQTPGFNGNQAYFAAQPQLVQNGYHQHQNIYQQPHIPSPQQQQQQQQQPFASTVPYQYGQFPQYGFQSQLASQPVMQVPGTPSQVPLQQQQPFQGQGSFKQSSYYQYQ